MPATQRHPATVLLVDDHPLMRKGLRVLLEGEPGLVVAGEADDGEQAIERVKALSPDIVIMDVSMPALNGIDATRRLLAEAPETKILAYPFTRKSVSSTRCCGRAPPATCSRLDQRVVLKNCCFHQAKRGCKIHNG